MLAKVRCVRHVPGTDFGAPGDMLAIVDADWGRARGDAWGADASKSALRPSCAWHQIWSPWGYASHC
jgi:hypothetical protein